MTALTFTYRAQLERVVDGDTLHVRCDLGLRLTYAMDVRLRGCNAAEKTTVSGQNAITYVTNLDGSKSLALDLIAAGLAVAWDGHGDKPVPPDPPLPLAA
jgi:endonuclease YncB( thermonuclease family)